MNINSSKAVQAAMFYADSYDDASGPIWFQKYNEKFAELIVKECLTLAEKRHEKAMVTLWNVDETMSVLRAEIEDHFGVEE